MLIQEFHKKMSDFFDIAAPGDFLDPLWLMQKKVKIDLGKFDSWLHKEVGEYEKDEGFNMKDALAIYYGEDASQFIGSLL
jgi:hypothetical protein